MLAVGGYALGSDEGTTFTKTQTADSLTVWSQEKGSILQVLNGFVAQEWDERLDDSTPRGHLSSPFHCTPVFTTHPLGRAAGEVGVVAALTWTGSDRAESTAWQLISADAHAWTLNHPSLGDWSISHPLLPALTV